MKKAYGMFSFTTKTGQEKVLKSINEILKQKEKQWHG